MIIKNKEELSSNSLRKDALNILERGYQSVMTENILNKEIVLDGEVLKIKDSKYDLKQYENIFVLAFGKCANESSLFIEKLLGEKIKEGIVLDTELSEFENLKSRKGSHPLPSKENMEIGEEIIGFLKKVGEKDLALIFVSGGASALLSNPVEGIDVDLLIKINKALMDCGTTIEETNIVRKHISRVKGGNLINFIKGQIVSCIFSDVPGDDLSIIASGPTVLDLSTKEDAKMILEKYSEIDESGILKEVISFLAETPKNQELFAKVGNHLLLTNKIALEAMKDKAQELGYLSEVKSFEFQGEARFLGPRLLDENQGEKICFIWGGESTVTLLGDGKGGRNQELVLAALENLTKDSLLLAVSSDGVDNSDVAGAFIDYDMFKKMQIENLDWRHFLEDNNSYDFFEKLGTQIKTGKTGINVADFILLLRK